jgi:transposase-like protein
MQICEKQVQLGEHAFREIRKLSSKDHQTSIITTHPTLEQSTVASQMFSRWSQENFFKYMIEEFDFDKLINYGTEVLDQNKQVVNPVYSMLYQQRKKLIEKRRRLEAQLFEAIENNINQSINETKKWVHKQADLKEKIEALQIEINQKIEALSKTPSKIKLADMPEQKRYNRLKKESKMFMNIIKMIAYKAETVLVNLIRPFYNNHENDRRQIIQTILASSANLEPDYGNNILKITIHTQATPRANKALKLLCEELNQTEISYPQTNLRLLFIAPVV